MPSFRFRLRSSPRPRRGGGAIVRVGAAIASGVVSAAVAAAPADPPRDYGAEAIAMIAEAQGVGADESDHGWFYYQHAATSIGGAARFFAMSSEALAEYAGGDEERFAVDVLAWLSDPAGTPDPTGVLASEGERLMRAMDRAGWWEALGPVREARAFVPPRQHGPMLGWSSFPSGQAAGVTSLCLARMRRAMEAGDFETAAIALEDALALTRAMSWTRVPITRHRGATLGKLLGAADLWRGQPEFARSALGAIERQAIAPARVWLERERLMGLGVIDIELARYMRDEIERRRAEGVEVDEGTFWKIVAPVMAPPAEQMERLGAIINAQTALLEARGKGMAPAQERLDALSEDLDRHNVVGLVLPSPGLRDHQRLRARDGAVRIALALEIHRAEAGEYPQSLAELEALDALPLDPWSDEPLRYRREADGGAIVYSVGQDGVDDGGRENSERPRAPEEQAPREMWEGFDLILYRAPGT